MAKLGFHAPYTRLYVFVKNEANHLWYYLEEGNKVFIKETAITGTIAKFEVKEVETSFDKETKADFEIMADRPYVLRSGVDTAFTKGMLKIISALSESQLKRPIALELTPGEQKNNVLVSARDPETFEFVRSGSWENVDWNALMNQALSRLSGNENEAKPASAQQITKPQPVPAVTQKTTPQATSNKPKLYPQHNALIKSVRRHTGHEAEQIKAWCADYGANEPSQLLPNLCNQLAESMAIGWGEDKFDSVELCENSFRGKVQTLCASGMPLDEAIIVWMESVANNAVLQ